MNTFVCKCEFLCSGGSCNEEVGEARIDLQCTSSMNVYKYDSGLILPPPCRLHAASPSVFVSPSPSLTFSQLPKHTEYTYNCFLTPWSLRLSCSCEYISMTLSLPVWRQQCLHFRVDLDRHKDARRHRPRYISECECCLSMPYGARAYAPAPPVLQPTPPPSNTTNINLRKLSSIYTIEMAKHQ